MPEKRSYLKDQHHDPAGEEPRRQVTDALRARQAAGPGSVSSQHTHDSAGLQALSNQRADTSSSWAHSGTDLTHSSDPWDRLQPPGVLTELLGCDGPEAMLPGKQQPQFQGSPAPQPRGGVRNALSARASIILEGASENRAVLCPRTVPTSSPWSGYPRDTLVGSFQSSQPSQATQVGSLPSRWNQATS